MSKSTRKTAGKTTPKDNSALGKWPKTSARTKATKPLSAHADSPTLAVSRVYVTPPESDQVAQRRTKAANARNRSQHKRVQPPAQHAARTLWRASVYDPKQDTHTARPGANDALAIPSRIGNRLHYRDGRVVDMGGAA